LKNARNELSDRLKAAAQAKTALLQAHKLAKEAAEPTRAARDAERLAIATAREQRRLEREQLKSAEQLRLQTEAAERQAEINAAANAEVEARKAAEDNRVSRVIEDQAARKAERDRRYANRKARNA
jgi:hypothetical protein